MAETGKIQQQAADTTLPVRIAIGLAFIIFGGFIPAPEPLTPVGMRVVGTFIGTVFMLATIDVVWPSLLAIAALSFTPLFTTRSALAESFGNWVTVFVLLSFMMTHALNESGFTTRLTVWFMTKKFVNRSPWIFTISLWLLVMLVSLLLDPVPVVAFFLPVAYGIFKELGYEKGDGYPVMVIIGLAFSANIAFGMTPISHPIGIILMGMIESVTGSSISILSYMLFGIPTGFLIFVAMIAVLRLLFKPDMEKFKDFDINKVLEARHPMDSREKLTVAIFFAVVLFWLLPGLLTIFAPSAEATKALNGAGPVIPVIFGVVLLCVVKTGGKPIFNFREASKSITWSVIYLIAGSMILAAALNMEDVGLNKFVTQKLMPLTESLPTIMVVFLIVAMTSVLTNFSASVPSSILIGGITLPLAHATASLSAPAMGVIVAFSACLAFCVPSAFASIAIIYGVEWSDPKQILKYGLITMLITIIFTTFIG
ncbi:MAG: SLC13 family permease, partial [Synergistaceae bacterium]|nr:SLC13 family permease [Synergistaceae bacterium]